MSTKDHFNRIYKEFLEDCENNDLIVDNKFAHFYVHLLSRDARLGLDDTINSSICRILKFRQNAIQLYKNSIHPTMCNLKMMFCFRNFRELKIQSMKEIYQENFEKKLHNLIEGILQYPETSNAKQLDEMLYKIQVFIIACYNIGDPKNHVLLQQTRQSLKSVLSHGDLQNFVLKKRYHRFEYLQRLTATVCGILIYNNCDPNGEKENMRDILSDIQMAKTNTKEMLEAAQNDIVQYINTGMEEMDELYVINTKEKKVHCKWPIEKIREINNYVILFSTYEKLLQQIVKSYENTEYLVSLDQKKMDCIIEKINDILKFRTAIESELIFPHFKYLTEIWTSLQLSFSHMAELNKLKDLLDECLSEEVKANFLKLLKITEVRQKVIKNPAIQTFHELMERSANKTHSVLNSLQNISDNFKNYCALTMALTNGLLAPAQLQKKLCEDPQFLFGFANIEFAKYSERYFEDFIYTLKTAIYTSVDLILFFDLINNILQEDFVAEIGKRRSKRSESGTQTEMVVTNDLTPANHINVTWNKWDFHRETIHLAYIRRLQTHSQQTALSFGTMNAQNECLPFGHRTS